MKKRLHLFLVFLMLAFCARSQTITVTSVTPAEPYCAGSQITVNYTVALFLGTDDFTIELGNFGTFPGTILATNTHGWGSRSYIVTIPPNTALGNYSIRVNRITPTVNSNQYVLGVIKALDVAIVPRSTTCCAGSTQQIDYSICGSYNATNDFSIQLSDATGSFAAPVTIGTLTNIASGSGTASVTIPTTAVGEFYKIRFVSNSPVVTQTLATPITIVAQALCNCSDETNIDWQASFGGTLSDELKITIPTPDGGYLLGGFSTSNASANKTRNSFGLSDYWLIKTDGNGVKQWDSIYGGSNFDQLYSIIPTNDGGYLLGGSSQSSVSGNKTRNTFGNTDYWIVKIDANGTKQWDSIYGGTDYDYVYEMIPTSDGGFLLGGQSFSNAGGNKTRNKFGFYDYWIVKIDANGTKQWDSIYGGTDLDYFRTITSTSDGGYLLGGYSISNISGNKTRNTFGLDDYWLVKINVNGTKQWDSIYGGANSDELKSIISTTDGGYLLSGNSASNISGNKTKNTFGLADYWIVKIDANGAKQWDSIYGGTVNDILYTTTSTQDGGFILGGYTESNASGNKTINSFGLGDYWTVKINANGTKINEKEYGGSNYDIPQYTTATKDGGYLIGGHSLSGINGNKTTTNLGSYDYWLVKVAPALELSATSHTTTICAGNTMDIDYSINSCNSFKTGNDLKVELSDAAGSFTSATTLLTQATVAASGTLTVTIPASAAGEFYKIRVIASSPIDTVIIGDLFTIVATAQCNCTDSTIIEWQAEFGGTDFDDLNIIIPTPDGGYLLGGSSSSNANGNKTRNRFGFSDYWIVKIDANGTKQWDSSYGGINDETLKTIISTNDGGYLLGGYSESNTSGNKTRSTFGLNDYWVVKINANGTKQWDSIYGGTAQDLLNIIAPTSDGGYLLAGNSESISSGNKTRSTFGATDYWVVKINANGTKQWDSIYGGTSSDGLGTIIPTVDGGYLLGGNSYSNTGGYKTRNTFGLNDYWVVKINANGTKQWDSIYGGSSFETLYSISTTSDGGYMLGGYSQSNANGNKTRNSFGNADYWIVKINVNGTKQWDSIYGGSDFDILYTIEPTTSGGYLLGGYSRSNISGNKTLNSFGFTDYWIININANGTKVKENTYGGTLNDGCTSIKLTEDGGYLLGGYSHSGINGNKTTSNFGPTDYWLVKVAPPLELSATARTTTICAGNMLDIDYSTSCTAFKAGNNIKVELSDATGSFTSATILLTQATVAASGTLTVTIPSTAAGEFYKIRVSSSSPIDTVIISNLFTIVATAQCNCTDSTIIDWQAEFGGSTNDGVRIIIPTSDGGYLLGGISQSNAGGNKTRNSFGNYDYWLVKINGNGIKQWDSIYGGTNGDYLTSITSTNDGGYLLGGYSASNASGNKTRNTVGLNDYWLVKIDANGTKQWDSIYGGTIDNKLFTTISTNDGGYLLGGISQSNAGGNKTRNSFGLDDYWLVKIDANGTKQWDSIYGGASYDNLYSIIPSSDGGFLLGGTSQSNLSGNKTRNTFGLDDYWLVKINANGTKQWDSIYGGINIDYLNSIKSTNDGGFLLGGYSSSTVSGNKTRNTFGLDDYWLVKIDANGTKQWDSIYGGTIGDRLSDITPTSDGNYLLSGYSASLISGNKTTNTFGSSDYWVVKINANGTKLKENVYGGIISDFDPLIIATDDGGYLVGGLSTSGINGNKTTTNFGNSDYWLVKVAPALELSATSRTTTICAGNTLDIDYSITSCNNFKAGNNIKVELSDAAGSFASATTLLIQATVAASGTLTVTIPASAAGEFYKIRVSSSSPIDTVIIGDLFTIVATAQCNCTDETVIDWQASFGGTGSDVLDIMIPTPDGGYLLGGRSASNAGGNKTRNTFGNTDYWIVKIDANGVKQWDSIYGGVFTDELKTIIPTNDGGYLLGGFSSSSSTGNKTRNAYGNEDYWIVKIDANGTKQWDSIYGGTAIDLLETIITTNDGGYLLGGTSLSSTSGNKTRNSFGSYDIWIVKIDANGTKQWDSIFGGTGIDNLRSITATNNGGYLLAGYSASNAGGNKTRNTFGGYDYWVVKINANGTKQWDSIYGGSSNDVIKIIIPTSDGGFLLSGSSESAADGNKTRNTFGITDYWIVKTDANGVKQWDSIYGGTNTELFQDMIPTSDGGYLFGGLSSSTISGNKTTANFGSNDYWLVKIDVNGTKLNEKGYGGTSTDNAYSIIATKDGGHLIGGYSSSLISGNKTTTNIGSDDYWIVKVAPQLELSATPRTTTICAGNTLDIDYSITSCSNFKAGNNLKVELSDAAGSFASATTLLTQATVAASGTLTVTTPASAVGEFYKIRVSSSSPIDTVIISNLFTIVAAAQCNCTDETTIDWQVSFGGANADQLNIMIPTSDGGFLLGGQSQSNAGANKTRNSFGLDDYWLVKIDANGIKQWDSIYGGTGTDILHSITPTIDGGFLLGGQSNSNANGNKTRNTFGSTDYWLVKIDANGTKQWDSIYGGTSNDIIFEMISTADGGYLLSGASGSTASGNKTRNTFGGGYDYWVVKIDANGTKQWDSIYGGTAFDYLTSISSTKDGGFLLGGYSSSTASGNKTRNTFGSQDYWIVKIDVNGTKQWDSIYGGTNADYPNAIIPTTDGGYLLGGISSSNTSGNKTRNTFGLDDYWIVKIDENGTKKWDSIYGGTSAEGLSIIISTVDGGYILAGRSASGITGNKTINSFSSLDYWPVKINANGTKINEKVYGGTSVEYANSIIATKDGGYLIGGYSLSGINGNKTTANLGNEDYWLVKVAPALELSATPRSTTICAGNTLDIDYSINSCGVFKAGNTLKVELSNAAGSFASATTLLTQATVAASGTLTVTIPTTAAGEFYKIRVSSSSPIDTIIIGDLFTVVTQSQCNCTDKTVIDWQASFGGTSDDALNIMIPTSDGGYLLGGSSLSNVSATKTRNTFGLQDYWLVKIDSNGVEQWDSIYGGTAFDELRTIVPTNDGGYLLGGHSQSNIGGNKTRNTFGNTDYWIVKIDASGTKQWDSIYGSTSTDLLYSIIPTVDGGYLLGGYSSSFSGGNKTRNTFGNYDYWLVKINANGTKQWDSIYGGTSSDGIESITPTTDGGYLLGGSSSSIASGNKTRNTFGSIDYWIVKIDANGTKLWDSIYGGTAIDDIFSIKLTTDGGYLLGGFSQSNVSGNKTRNTFGSSDFWLVKIDANGTKQWDSIYGGVSGDFLNSMVITSNGEYLLSGRSSSNASGNKTLNTFGGEDYWLLKINANGTKINEKVYGGTGNEWPNSILSTDDGGYLIGGYSISGINGNKTTANFGSNDYWLVKVAPAPKITPVSVSRAVVCSPDSLTVYFDKECGTFKTGNKFYVQLSDSLGSFTTPFVLDSITSIITPNSIIANTPSGLTESSTYQIRIVSSLPKVISDTVSNIQILTYPNLSTLTESCALGKEFSAVVPASSSKQWQLNGVDIGSATASSYFPILFGNYRLRTFNAACRDTSNTYTVIPANAVSANTCTIADGLTRFICDNTTGDVIAKIVDAAGGNILDTTNSDMYIDASVQYYQTQPYVQRHYDITPKSSGAAAITLYVPQSEYNAYNTVASTFWPHLPSGPADVTNMNNLVITQYHGTSATHLPGTYSDTTEYLQFPAVVNTWNAATSMWEVNFSVTAFSGIFLHTRQGFTLPVELISFSGKYFAAQALIKLSWQTASELNCAYFEVERMKADGSFEYIGTVDCNGTTNVLNSYTLDDLNYIIGNNYYRLKQVDENGNIEYSKIAIVKVTASNEFYFQTIADDNQLLTIFSSESGNAALYDNNGRLLQTIPLNEKSIYTTSINYLAKGVYFIRFENEKNTKTNKIIVK